MAFKNDSCVQTMCEHNAATHAFDGKLTLYANAGGGMESPLYVMLARLRLKLSGMASICAT